MQVLSRLAVVVKDLDFEFLATAIDVAWSGGDALEDGDDSNLF